LADNGQIELPDCEVKVRLTPDPSQNDYWWPIASESINEIFDLIMNRSEEFSVAIILMEIFPLLFLKS